MTWIKTCPVSESTLLQEILAESMSQYPAEYRIPVEALADADSKDEGAGIVMAHSLIPEALRHAFSTFGKLMDPELPLSRRQHELIAGTVSTLNKCFY